VNFNTVAQTAGVSTAWLYRQEALKMRIMQLREQDARRARARRSERASETAKDAVIKTLRSRIKELDSENKALRRQIEALYGQLLESGKPSAEASVKDV
jgi:predicted RNase H-like nuclease (RuvC/YqgF family)